MSKNYIRNATKRQSYGYTTLGGVCKLGQPHNHIRCGACMSHAGSTRNKQKEFATHPYTPKHKYHGKAKQ
jgi:hypothetical protein